MKLIEPHSEAAINQGQRPPFESESDEHLLIEAADRVGYNRLESTTSRTAKRAIDLAMAVACGIILSPVLVAIAVAIKCVSRGPVLYSQLRLGHDGIPFRMWKFRTMVTDAERRLENYLSHNPTLYEEWTTGFKLREDPRVIPWIGRALRKSSLDELPQLWNVLVGDMSLVGPRPLPPYHLDQFEEDFRRLRGTMPPGITGQWQVCSRNYGAPEMFRKWDSYYVQNWSIWLDLQILSRTPWAVVSGKGAG